MSFHRCTSFIAVMIMSRLFWLGGEAQERKGSITEKEPLMPFFSHLELQKTA